MKSTGLFLGTVLLLSTVSGTATDLSEPPVEDHYPQLTVRLEVVREALGIPGMAAALVQDQELVWARGFGYADIGHKVAATPHTPFGLASVTKPVAATLVMQLVEEGTVDLDAPIEDYGVSADGSAVVTVRHLLTHTSEGTPGKTHSYNGNRYGLLGGVIEGATGSSFAELLGKRILLPVGMMDTALNPIDSWDDATNTRFEDFARSAGWGDSFSHYPDVYHRLTSPYQLSDEYEIVPGMYHLIHSPAAGMLSSVADLAAFDIALDRGELLSPATMTEMFSPAVTTVEGRSDFAYGLGWYVQEWAGHRMLWHTGRWPPSTSALYLKLPDEGLTFIVLANTDNMTTPFPGIGSGDLSRSTLMLTVFEQLVFDVPTIDWMATEDALIDQLGGIEDADTRLFLELELWSYRQALASSGDLQQAAVLAEVNREVFPTSRLRLDNSYTYTAPAAAAVPPVVSAASFATLALVIMVWLLIAAVSVVVVGYYLARRAKAPVRYWATALPAAAVMGPVVPGVLVRGKGGGASLLHRAAVAGIASMSGYALAWIVAIPALLGSGDEANPLLTIATVFVLPVVIGLFLVRLPALRKESGLGFGEAMRAAVMPEIMTAVLGVGALVAATVFFDNHLLSMIPHPRSPFFWGMLSVGALIGLVLLTLHYLLVQRRGSITIPSLTSALPQALHEPQLPRWRDSWWVLLGNVVVVTVLLVVLG
ncbi:MAG: serine hydrolase domain-containing protein [Acidimicrobiia bacterium]|nr:serine hydrolase domain-containing protein [Acidimicrobiia bacterium]